MSHAGDWKGILEDPQKQIINTPLCDTCEGHGVLEEDLTPSDWWNTGPLSKEIACEDCPRCDLCFARITKEEHPGAIKIDLPDWEGLDPDPWNFCSRLCFTMQIRFVLNPDERSIPRDGFDDYQIAFRQWILTTLLNSQDF